MLKTSNPTTRTNERLSLIINRRDAVVKRGQRSGPRDTSERARNRGDVQSLPIKEFACLTGGQWRFKIWIVGAQFGWVTPSTLNV